MKPAQTIINLWSGPRNISTAMMYAFSQRKDVRVFDEPLYAHYLRVTGLNHPGREEVLAAQNNDGDAVMDNFLFDNFTRPVLFLKQMTHHLVDIDLRFLEQSKNIILIRDPKKVLHSYGKVIEQPTLEDIGIKQSFELFEYLQKAQLHCLVVDADTILIDPEAALKTICVSCDIPFLPVMLSWAPGPKKADGVWAKYWYENVHASSGFQEYQEEEIHLLSNLQKVYETAVPFYEKLKKHAI
ncbi:MAG: hypothetical protein WBP43_15585 [Chitinophagales bacterium]